MRIYPGSIIGAKPAAAIRVEQIRRRKFRTSDSYLHIRLYACPFLAKTRLYRSRRYIAVVLATFEIQPGIANGGVYGRYSDANKCVRAESRHISSRVAKYLAFVLPMFFLSFISQNPLPHLFPHGFSLERFLCNTHTRKNPSGMYLTRPRRTGKSSNPLAFAYIKG